MSATTRHVAFLTEAGPEVGLGHVMRCLALARAAAADGARASFLLAPDPRAIALLGRAGQEVVPAPWPADPAATRGALAALGADTVVVDSYAASAGFLASLRPDVARVVAVDDMADRGLPVDLVVNGGVGAEALPYRRRTGTRFLLGPRYALLDPAFAEAPAARRADRVSRILICLGGGGHEEPALAALAAAAGAAPGCAVDLVAGALATDGSALEAAARRGAGRIAVHRDRLGLRDLMLAADLAVSGAGVTLHELLATATPAVVICMADNQRPNAAAVERRGAALVAGSTGDPGLRERLESALGRLAGDRALREALGARGRALVDGGGALRVARALGRPAVSRR
jgi:UDP-2,4-diacetamido-2,4,6-trideoxy-beta-L-altropyranose hydrolase